MNVVDSMIEFPVVKHLGQVVHLSKRLALSGPSGNYTTEVLVTKALYWAYTDRFLGTAILFLQLSLADMLALDAEPTVFLLPPKTRPLHNSARPQLACDVAFWQCNGVGRRESVRVSPGDPSQSA